MGLDLIAGVAIGAFLIAVASQGNSGKMLDLAKRDKGFLKWAVAVGILYYLYDVPELKPILGTLIALAALGFLIIATGNTKINFFDNVSKLWDSLN